MRNMKYNNSSTDTNWVQSYYSHGEQVKRQKARKGGIGSNSQNPTRTEKLKPNSRFIACGKDTDLE